MGSDAGCEAQTRRAVNAAVTRFITRRARANRSGGELRQSLSRDTMTAPPPPEPTRVIVVTNVLPVHLERDDEGRWTASWDEEIGRPESSLSRYLAIGVRKLDTPHVFVGSPECFVPKAERAAVEEAIAAAGLSCVCVYHEVSVDLPNLYR